MFHPFHSTPVIIISPLLINNILLYLCYVSVPLSTDPLSTDPLSTDPLSTDPLSFHDTRVRGGSVDCLLIFPTPVALHRATHTFPTTQVHEPIPVYIYRRSNIIILDGSLSTHVRT